MVLVLFDDTMSYWFQYVRWKVRALCGSGELQSIGDEKSNVFISFPLLLTDILALD